MVRSAPKGKLWAERSDVPVGQVVVKEIPGGFVVSAELARDLGWQGKYPSWPEYPGVVVERGKRYKCIVCDEAHLTAESPYHTPQAERPVGYDGRKAMVGKCYWCGTKVPKEDNCCNACFKSAWKPPRFGPAIYAETPDISAKTPENPGREPKLRTETLDTPKTSDMVQAACGHMAKRPKRGPLPKWCSDACRKKAGR